MPLSSRQMPRLLAAGVTLIAMSDGTLAGQNNAPATPAYTARSTAILVDVIVRDRKGKPVLDLTRDDFDIAEDGVKQDIASFTLVSRGAGIGVDVRMRRSPGATTVVQPTGMPSPEAMPSVIALVFDALSSESLTICQRAALQHIGHHELPSTQMGVFASDPGLRMLQRYTSEPALIRGAIQRLTSAGTAAHQLRDERIDQLRERQAASQTVAFDPGAVTAIASGAIAENANQVGNAEVQRLLLRSELKLLQAFEALDRDQRGYGATSTLLAVLESMAPLPGRKSVVLFSEGLPASPALQSRLQTVVEAANRSNITIYAVDAVGLRVESSTTETRREVTALGEERLRQASMPEDQIDGPLTRAMERAEDLMRYSGEAGLARVAEDTGGFLTRDTNDVGSAFRRIDEDQRFHYLLTYSPRNDVTDGKFRTIDVKVRRPGTAVFARRGYRATRDPSSVPLLSYEGPALALLDASQMPRAFPAYALPFSFPERSRPGLVPLVVRVTTDALRFEIDSRTAMYSAQVVVVARIRDASGRVVQKVSQQYVLNGTADEISGAKKGEILFYREIDLPAGAYQVDSIVYDVLAQTGSARVATLVVPGADSQGLQMSSLVLVSKTEEVRDQDVATGDRTSPFYFGRTLLYPNVGEPLAKGSRAPLGFYFVVYPDEPARRCTARISLLRNGASIAEVSRPLEAGNGARLAHVGHVPIDELPSGVYELRVTVTDGAKGQTRAAFFTVG